MAAKLDRQYLEDHLGVHTYESFGRAIVAAVLEETLDRMAAQDDEGFGGENKFMLETGVESNAAGCIWTYIIVNGRRIRIHTTPIYPSDAGA